MLFNNSTSGLLTSDTRDFKIQDVTVFTTRWPGKNLERGRFCKRGKFKLRFATRWGQYQYINPYEGFDGETKNGFLPKNSRITVTLLGGRNYRRRKEFSVFYEAYAPQNLPFQHSAYEKFSLENKNSAECKADFRVDKRDITLLVEALRVPPIFKCSNGTICDGTEGLCIVLKRFAYPCRYSDMMPIFGRSVPELSMICNQDRRDI